jgi:thymidylate synthase ThyX
MAKRKYNSMDEVPESIKVKLSKYFTNVGGDTFVIHDLPPELTGGVMARYSRAPTGLQLTLVNEFLDDNGDPSQEKGSELIDRVLNDFGDESVGELENAHVGLEDISQLLTKDIEDRRIGGSPIEQSTRYVKYDGKDSQGKWRYLRPAEIMHSGLGDEFERVNDRAFEVYSEGIKRLSEFFKTQIPRDNFKIKVERGGEIVEAGESELVDDNEKGAFRTAYGFTVRCAALDVGRCVLPSSTLTHLGNNGNGRFWTNVLTHFKSSDFNETRERAVKLEEELKKTIPTFIKRNRVNEYQIETRREMNRLAKELFGGITPEAEFVTLMPEAPYIDQTVASSLYPFTHISLRQIKGEIRKMPEEKKLEILQVYTGKRKTRRDRTGRGLEAGYPLTFDLIGGFAEYRDLERHRVLTQQRQRLTTDLGFIMPPEFGIVGLEKEAEEVAGMMASLNSDLKRTGLEEASQYATLFNNRLRYMLGMNMREFQHLSELRTQPFGHFSYRSMVMEMARQTKEKYPWTAVFNQFVDYSDPGNKISRAREQSRIAGKNLASGVDGSLDLD